MKGPAMTEQAPATPAAETDGSLLEELGDVVDVVLGEDIAPPEPEGPWERRQRLLDSWTAIILAVAAIATAWASFQASQWSGAESDFQSQSAIARSDAGRAETQATSATTIDSQMWLSWLGAYTAGQKQKSAFLAERFSPQLQVAQKAWLAGATFDAQGAPVTIPAGTPLTIKEYVVPVGVVAQTRGMDAEALLGEADDAAGHSTQFVLLAVILALVLFFASVATKFTQPKVQVLLTAVSLFLLATTMVRMLFLPHLLW